MSNEGSRGDGGRNGDEGDGERNGGSVDEPPTNPNGGNADGTTNTVVFQNEFERWWYNLLNPDNQIAA